MSKKYIEFKNHETDERTFLIAKNAICPRCAGEGHIGNPAFDGLSPDDMDRDPQFFEDYFLGHYDVKCPECQGRGMVLEIDEEANKPEELKAYYDYMQMLADDRAGYEAERRAGA